MSPETPRRIAWSEETDATKMRLILGNLDDMDEEISAVRKEVREAKAEQQRKLNIILTCAAGCLVAICGNLAVLLLTR